MVAPTPVSGLLHAVAVVKSGVFGIARVLLDVYGVDLTGALGMGLPLAVVAAATLLLASVIALRQDNLKRRLAYSTVSQLSYIVLGLAILDPQAIVGGLLHIPAHAFMKLTLFFTAGAIHVETHTDDISDMAGIGKRMPLTMLAFGVAAAGMAGIPLVAGFVSKWYVLIGSVNAGQPVFAVVLLVSGVLNVAYFWPVFYQAFFESEDAADAKPLIEFSLGGESRSILPATPAPDSGAITDGGHDDGTDDHGHDDHGYDKHDEHGHDDEHDDDHGGPPADGWERRGWRGGESTWFMLGPILAAMTGAVVLGVIPRTAVFLRLIEVIVAAATGVGV
jgi:NADH-quinone oxidoreductase subunit L/multicomponent Na+:H+ antiporter subunit D